MIFVCNHHPGQLSLSGMGLTELRFNVRSTLNTPYRTRSFQPQSLSLYSENQNQTINNTINLG